MVGEWLHPARQRFWANGIQALLPMIEDRRFENMPPIFKLIQPIIESAPGILQTDIGNLINALYKDSPSETEYFLREVLENSSNPLTVATLRRLMPTFPKDLQANLRKFVMRN